jgi:hypothetical protein
MKIDTLYLYAAEISVGDMKGFLRQIGLAFDYLILEFYQRVVFERFDLDLVNCEDYLNRGRAFSNKCEIRWRRKDDIFVVALTTDEELNDETAKKFTGGYHEVAYARRQRNGFLLWGEYLDRGEVNGKTRHRWFEKRIPKPQFYPVDAESTHIGLKAVDYYDNEGRPIARRVIEPYPWAPKKEGE